MTIFHVAEEKDLVKIIEIYNQVIESRSVTADLKPVTVKKQKSWFDSHRHSSKYPIWILEQDHEVVGWCAYSQFYGRAAYDCTVEISFYLDRGVQGKGFGEKCVDFLIEQMSNHGLTTLIAFVFGNNRPSLRLLEKKGFQRYGLLPQVANMQTHRENLVILGIKKYD